MRASAVPSARSASRLSFTTSLTAHSNCLITLWTRESASSDNEVSSRTWAAPRLRRAAWKLTHAHAIPARSPLTAPTPNQRSGPAPIAVMTTAAVATTAQGSRSVRCLTGLACPSLLGCGALHREHSSELADVRSVRKAITFIPTPRDESGGRAVRCHHPGGGPQLPPVVADRCV